MSPSLPRGIVRMPAVRRWTLRVAVLGLIGAPLLANVWPALGRGQMLYVGETAAGEHRAESVSLPRAAQEAAAYVDSRASAHAHHDMGHAHERESRNPAHDGSNTGAPRAHEAHEAHEEAAASEGAPAPTGESTASNAHARHGAHCALCVLASLAWAPHVQPGAGQTAAVPIPAPLPKPATVRRTNDPRTRVHARAPPALS